MTMTGNGLAKLIEECGEVIQICAKKLACMDSDVHWDGAGSLKQRMEDEIADMAAASMLVIGTFDLDTSRIGKRTNEKLALFTKWHQQQNDAPKDGAPPPAIDPLMPPSADPLYEAAVKVVLEHRSASISTVQRHLRAGYNRTARLLEEMERQGVVSPMNSTGARKVLQPKAGDATS